MDANRPTVSDELPWRGLLELARCFGTYSWTSLRIFEMLGQWSRTEADPSLKLGLDANSRQFYWHSEVWYDRLPELAEVYAESLVRAPSIRFAEVLDRVAQLSGSTERVASLSQLLLPELIHAYSVETLRLDEVASATALRWIPLMNADLEAQIRWGEAYLQDNSGQGSEPIAPAVIGSLASELRACGGLQPR